MRIEVAGNTHVGMKRNHNEDNFLLLPEENLVAVADGMGGHSAGEIASKVAIDEMAEFFRLTGRDQDATWPFKADKTRGYDENRLITGIKLANSRIYELASNDSKYKGMGTTLVSLLFVRGEAYIGWAGDSRGYRFRDGELTQLSEDHSLLNDYIKARRLTPEEIENFPHKNVIVRALGMKDLVDVDVIKDEPKEGDIYLLCSDGLSGMIDDSRITEILRSTSSLDSAAGQLIDSANAAGGSDNVTVVLARWIDR